MSARLESSMTTKNCEATWWTSDEKLLTNERKLKDLLDISSSNDEESILCSFGASGGATISRMLARKSIVWAKDSLERLPIRLTLENVGVFTLFLALLMPRAITYWLLYPLFRLVFGTLYPAYASYKAVRTKNVKEYVKWMMYWIVFALFTCAETFTDVFFSFWFPFYYEIKIILVLWLLSPATKGSSILYRRFVHPALCRREAEIDDALARATEQGYTAVLQLGSKGVNYATTVLMQTAIKGGGGLVQQLRKSYSLSDLTGEKEDENRNHEHLPDEVDLDEPRRRERSGRRGYSPRRTQSSSNRMEMYFTEVDLDVRQSRSREPVGSLTNIKSSDDISSGYSSGEALQSQRSSTTSEHLVRTASVGARNRTKPRTTTKKSPEVDEMQEDEQHVENIEQLSLVNPLSLLTPEQTLEILSFLNKHKDHIKMIQGTQNLSDSDDDSTLKADLPPAVKIEVNKDESKQEDIVHSVIDVKVEEVAREEPQDNKIVIDVTNINKEMCSEKLDELKELLQNANKAVATIVSSQENLSQLDGEISIIQKTNTLEIKSSPSISRSSSPDCSERAGKYHKKPAPKAPETSKEEDDEEEEKALKATLVIKTGTVKSFTDNEPVKRRKKSSAKTAARDSFSKLLTIPKNIFHNAFHKDSKEDDAKSLSSEKSVSCENVDVTNVLLHAMHDDKNRSSEGDTYISLRSDSIDGDIATSQVQKPEEEEPKNIRKEETIV
ncbi:uncharacterized protein LOC100120566 isoform X2 [Nasonia vitripennis]|nr:uncharacterized protein LOC100120566 isoform X2 [Nasonia vitripennis]XP_032454862.1 uncharacterized protein LOC100120566 isoform X2 [Nasonia vitripennis]XP_032454863.1 uncharacterized protein LOC100120566 isoform X2 [Nasonia vitripennis]